MIREYYRQYPFKTILLVALFIRVLAAIFSEGYGFHDDHFDVTRVANAWANGIPHWLENGIPPKHSMFYAGLNAGIIWVVQQFGIEDPYLKTMAMRFVHAAYTLLIVFFSIKITLLIADEKRAKLVGWITALLWFMPFMGVRFLVEMACIPPLLFGFYLLIKSHKEGSATLSIWLLSGAMFGLSFAFRYHTILFAGGLGLVLLFRKEWLGSALFTLGYLLAAFLTVGLIDLIIFDYPFHSIVEYFGYNSSHSGEFISGSPFKFTLTTFGFLIPPVSVFLMIGYVRSYKIEPLMFMAVLVFFVFHSSFPNQQERFILPMFPMLIILGTIGWKKIAEGQFLTKYSIIPSVSWKFFWLVNFIGGAFMCFTFTKKDRVDPLHYLYEQKDAQSVIIENERSVKQPPVFYLGNNYSDFNEWNKGILGLTDVEKMDKNHYVVYSLNADKSVDSLKNEIRSAGKTPNYVIFQGANNLDDRKKRVEALYENKALVFKTEIEPSSLDKMLHFFNPRIHRDQTATIFKLD
ncbi:glycosyltransferase family 39 protein [Fulvivirga sp.]|uniref:glycosyltransferase family 39 protein n=1 Tax=Fulvivirga sp. TaxID=1931237 RepID=UPI0032ECCC55